MDIFEREEKKYMLTDRQYRDFMDMIKGYMREDEYPRYRICNIYYDTDNYDLLRASTEKPPYKEKIRLRGYGKPSMGDKVFIELKKKYNGIVYKRRIRLALKDAYEMIESGHAERFDSYMDEENRREIKHFLKRHDLSNGVYLSYEREAYVWEKGTEFRMTFDTDLMYKEGSMRLDEGIPKGAKPVMPEGMHLMEIKVNGAMPMELVHALSKVKAYPVSFSKIGKAYTDGIAPSFVLAHQHAVAMA